MSDDRPPPGLDLGALRRHLDAELPGLVRGALGARLIEGGRSNLTYAVTDDTGTWVVRRPPLGHVLATAHDMAREHRVLTALRPTPVPVPRTLLLCTDDSVLGAPFYVMEFAPGTAYRTAGQLAALGPARTREIVLGLVDTLVDLHAVDPGGVGLDGFGRPDGFLERQLRRWGKQLDASRSRDLPGIDPLHDALARDLPPAAAPAVVHGDYRLDNVLVDSRSGTDTLTAVLDWEMSTLGDPLADLGLLTMYSTPLGGPGPSPVPTTADAPGHPTAAEITARYADRSGRDVSRVSWYTAFAYFKLAVILEGIHYRHTLGQTVGGGFDRIGEVVPLFIAGGLTTLEKG
ncbi:phosphotransferase family protein [Streptomyces sp. MAR4 CNX-425]|uniref:phosphotransferase family protein n=1 Tax=Streptomyces sp. MAR4 CNX-425 TaxID=3406343 RepID=UPI003B5137FA